MSHLLSRALFRPQQFACSLAATAAAAAASPAVPPRRFAGHARWQNVKADKDAGSAQKHAITTNVLQLLRRAVIQGDGSTNPETNIHLKAVFDRARSENISHKILERALATKSEVEPYIIEVRGRGGICVLVQSISAARIKCRQEVAHHMKKIGLDVVGIDTQITQSFFSKKGRVEAIQDPVKLPSIDRAMELALEFDCSDVRLEGGENSDGNSGSFVFECEPHAVSVVTEGLRSSNVDVIDSGIRYEPINIVELDADTGALLRGTYEKIRELVEGVIDIIDNINVAGG